MMKKEVDISELIGKTLVSCLVVDGDTKLVFSTQCNCVYEMYHLQDCCESVVLEDVCGQLDWLVGSPILRAECRTNEKVSRDYPESETWTFYELATLNGAVTLRWYGTSNGYYSEKVSFLRIK